MNDVLRHYHKKINDALRHYRKSKNDDLRHYHKRMNALRHYHEKINALRHYHKRMDDALVIENMDMENMATSSLTMVMVDKGITCFSLILSHGHGGQGQ